MISTSSLDALKKSIGVFVVKEFPTLKEIQH